MAFALTKFIELTVPAPHVFALLKRTSCIYTKAHHLHLVFDVMMYVLLSLRCYFPVLIVNTQRTMMLDLHLHHPAGIRSKELHYPILKLCHRKVIDFASKFVSAWKICNDLLIIQLLH